MDEEEIQKRFTDCVYFLASPLTCKKGIECEYRHSEIARLNPRDCWYWLGGCCFNPDCAFRHPPLEGLKEPYYEPPTFNNPPALPIDKTHKTNTPCYFYSKGFCNKGEKCSFFHAPADVSIPLKPSKPTTIPSEKKPSAESQTGSPPVKPHPKPSETPQIDHTNTVKKPTEDYYSHQEISTEESHEESTEESESDDVSNSLELQEEYVQSESDVFNDQSSGFDVVVEGEGEGEGESDYEQDVVEYEEDVVDYFSDHEKGVHIEYNHNHNHGYNELGNGFVKERLRFDDGLLDKTGEKRTSIFCRLSFKKRNFESNPKIFNGRNNDLREHLKRRKVVDGGLPRVFSQGYDGNLRMYPQRKIKKTVPVKNFKKPQQKRGFEEKSGGVFTGPKTLDEIKQEKKKNVIQRKDGFEGPRPLSEILMNKRKLG